MHKKTAEVVLGEYIRNHPTEAARLLEYQATVQVKALLDSLDGELASSLIYHMDAKTAIECLPLVTEDKTVEILETLPADYVAFLLSRFRSDYTEKLLKIMSPERATIIKPMMAGSDGSVATIMDIDVYSIPEDIRVGEAHKRLAKQNAIIDSFIFVVTTDHKPAGFLTFGKLFKAQTEAPIADVMENFQETVFVDDEILKLGSHSIWQKYPVLPVVDYSGNFLGIVRYLEVMFYQTHKTGGRLPRNLIDTGNALGELYRIGINSLLSASISLYQGTHR